ncbi:MAG: hypothetical protein WCJ04_09760 [Actinomycetes bacterium]
MVTFWPSKNDGTRLATSGFQITIEMPMSAIIKLMVTTILTTSLAPSMPRMIPRSMSAPKAGPMTNTTSKKAGSVGTPQPMCTCQNINAAIIEKAP